MIRGFECFRSLAPEKSRVELGMESQIWTLTRALHGLVLAPPPSSATSFCSQFECCRATNHRNLSRHTVVPSKAHFKTTFSQGRTVHYPQHSLHNTDSCPSFAKTPYSFTTINAASKKIADLLTPSN